MARMYAGANDSNQQRTVASFLSPIQYHWYVNQGISTSGKAEVKELHITDHLALILRTPDLSSVYSLAQSHKFARPRQPSSSQAEAGRAAVSK